MNKQVLGKGLKALIPDKFQIEKTEVMEIEIEKIFPNPLQPRTEFSQEKLKELANSIKEKGIIQPIIVKPKDQGTFEIIAGERRFRATKSLGIKKIPVLVKHVQQEEALEISLIENIQREELNLIDEAEAYKTLMEKFGLTQEKMAEKVGKDRASVANILRLLKLPQEIKKYLAKGKISFGHARALLSLDNNQQILLCQKIIEKGLSVRETEEIIKKLSISVEKKIIVSKDLEIMNIENKLRELFGTKAEIKKKGNKGKIEIKFSSEEELIRIIEVMNISID
ncbi:MAG: ParB/RepB/Spo0J family partition protein [bacterium]